ALKALELRPLRGDLEAQLGAFELPADDLCIAGGGAAQGGVLRLRVEGGDGAVYAAGLELDRARLRLDDALAERALRIRRAPPDLHPELSLPAGGEKAERQRQAERGGYAFFHAPSPSPGSGKETVKRVPPPSRASTSMLPPRAETASW